MEAQPSNFKTIIEGIKQFYVPLFQRPYTWGDKSIDILWNDIADLYEADLTQNTEHFIGSFVTVLDSPNSTPTGVSRYTVIDGQQRMTTLLLFLAAIRGVAALRQDTQFADMIRGLYLCNPYHSGDNNAKFVPTQADRIQFQAALELRSDVPLTSPVLQAAFKRIQRLVGGTDQNNQPYDMKRLHDIITMRLSLVSITLGAHDNAYVIFHSLNGKGEDLTEADLIRNYFFMRLPLDRQQAVYSEHWFPMQEALKTKGEFPDFFRHYLSKDGTLVNSRALYEEVKRRADDKTPAELEDYVAELARFANFYKRIINPALEPDQTIRIRLQRLNQWQVTVAYPLLLNLYDDLASARISADEFTSMIAAIESFVVRRFFCRVPTNRLNRIFAVAYGASVPDDSGSASDRTQTLPTFLLGQQWPDDTTFKAGFQREAIYSDGGRCQMILRLLENAEGHHEVVTSQELQIEHVMPQTLTDEWKQALGPEYQRIHDEWLHTIGNLTLTGYNPLLSNDPFADKQAVFATSNITLNAYFANVPEWTEAQIQARGEYLANQATRIWTRASLVAVV